MHTLRFVLEEMACSDWLAFVSSDRGSRVRGSRGALRCSSHDWGYAVRTRGRDRRAETARLRCAHGIVNLLGLLRSCVSVESCVGYGF